VLRTLSPSLSHSLVLDLTINGGATVLNTPDVLPPRFEFCWTAIEIGTKRLACGIETASIYGGYQRTKTDRVIPCLFQAGTTNFSAETPYPSK